MTPIQYAQFGPLYIHTGAIGVPEDNSPIEVHGAYTSPFGCDNCWGHTGYQTGRSRQWPISCPSCGCIFAIAQGPLHIEDEPKPGDWTEDGPSTAELQAALDAQDDGTPTTADDPVLIALRSDLMFVRALSAEREGVPCFGRRRGAYLHGRADMHHGYRRTRRVTRQRRTDDDYSQTTSDYICGMGMPHLFDTWCPSCHARLRVDARNRLIR